MKRILSPKQWAAALILFTGFSLATLFGYVQNHADAEFESFTEEFFLNELQTNPIHFHYSVDDPDAYHIDESLLKMPVYHEGDAANDIYALSLLDKQLEKYENKNLSDSNRYLYHLLESYIDALSGTAAYPYFSDPLSPSSGAPAELPILLAEYRFDTVEDVELYLSILTQIPDYFDGLMVYEQEKADAGLFMSDLTVDKVIRQCTSLMNPEQLNDQTHFLEVTFNSRLQELVNRNVLTSEEAASYQSENNRLLTTVVAPAYDRLADGLTLLRGSGDEICGLAHRPGGREYYKALLHLQTGSCRDIDEIKRLLYNDLSSNYAALGHLLKSDASIRDKLAEDAALLPEMSPEDILTRLKSAMQQDYPPIPADEGGSAIDCTIKYVDDSLEAYTAPAFYMTPPIDNVLNNTIYINEMDTSDELSLFTTLAHEGYPGHLYQTVYSQRFRSKSGQAPLRSVLYYGGYVEGWAVYAEMSSYDYAIELTSGTHPEAAGYYRARRLDRQIQLCLYSLLDIAIHYDGASYEDVRKIFASFGSLDDATIAAIYAYIAEEPCNYLKYYLGYLEILELKKQAAVVWYNARQTNGAHHQETDGSVMKNHEFLYYFHSFLLENGPADFGTLSDLLTDSGNPQVVN